MTDKPADSDSPVITIEHGDSKKPTVRAEGPIVDEMAKISLEAQEGASNAVGNILEEAERRALLSGRHPSFKSLPVPAIQARSETIPPTTRRVSTADQKAVLSSEETLKVLSLCQSLYAEMDMDFLSVVHQIQVFIWQGRGLNDEQQKGLLVYFLREITDLLSQYIIKKKTHVARTKMGMLAEKLFNKVGYIEENDLGAPEVVVDGTTVDRFQRIENFLQTIELNPEFSKLAEYFIDKFKTDSIS